MSENARILAVSKGHPAEEIKRVYDGMGLRHFGENYVQELKSKVTLLPDDIQWHFIGRLQGNKVKDLLRIPNLIMIESIENVHQVKEIRKHCLALDRTIEILIQVNCDQNEAQGGVSADLIPALIQECDERVRFKGFMTISPREHFAIMKELKTFFMAEELSMGMSGDYKEAIEQGATQVRIGTLLFGPRPRKQ